MKIAVDAMGGDFGPGIVVKGVCDAVRDFGLKVILVGNREAIEQELSPGQNLQGIEIVHASEVISMGDAPVVAVRKKKDSSIVRAVQLVKEGEAQAVVSAGSTGAAMAASLLGLGRIKGIDRPAIATVLPNQQGGTVVLDVGANADCRPRNLLQFALMGSLYTEKVLGIPKPRVGLLNIGEEETKGNELVLETFPLLKNIPVNFIGNVEGRDIFKGTVDVVVCDGFVGNVVLKAGEGMGMGLMTILKEELTKNWLTKMGTLLVRSALAKLKRRFDYAEYGGAPLLGVEGVSIISHGSSSSMAIKNAVRIAAESVQVELVSAIRNSMEEGLASPIEEKGCMNAGTN